MSISGFDLDKCNSNTENQLFVTIRGLLPPRPTKAEHESVRLFYFPPCKVCLAMGEKIKNHHALGWLALIAQRPHFRIIARTAVTFAFKWQGKQKIPRRSLIGFCSALISLQDYRMQVGSPCNKIQLRIGLNFLFSRLRNFFFSQNAGKYSNPTNIQ